MDRIRRLAAILLLLLAAAAGTPRSAAAQAEQAPGRERILSFASDIAIGRNGDLDVVETIRVLALGDRISHGIYRDFPTSYGNRYGQRTGVGFDIKGVERDGHPEPYALEELANGVRIRIGDAARTVPPGQHVYLIRYRTTRQIFYGRTSDELYWNVTGNGWVFPIDRAEARVTLPAPARFGARAVYTGPQGATEHDARIAGERPGLIAFGTTRPLDSNSGLTIAVAFPKGVLDEPGPGRRLGWWLQDWGALGTALVALGGILAYYARAWAKAGRGPKPGPVVPLFTPPDGLSAAACRYVSRMEMDDRAFTAAIVQLGVLGRLQIRKEANGWFSKGATTLERATSEAAPPAAERAMLCALFADGGTIALEQANHRRLQQARAALAEALAAEHDGRDFLTNRNWAAYGLFVILLGIMASCWIAIVTRTGSHVPEATAPLAGIALLVAAWKLHRVATDGKPGSKLLSWIGLVLALGLGAICAFNGLLAALGQGSWAVLLPLAALPIGITAFSWMYAPTPEGRRLMDRIAGFRHYLGITEEDRLDTLHPPEKTPELFERYLPYAIALDVENRWADRFAGVLAAAAAAGAGTQAMGWYSGDGNAWDDPGGFAESVGSSLASTVSSASTSPSSSSGSGGGGSSGGGGGGGGGGGW